jgi:hypothetical protein
MYYHNERVVANNPHTMFAALLDRKLTGIQRDGL